MYRHLLSLGPVNVVALDRSPEDPLLDSREWSPGSMSLFLVRWEISVHFPARWTWFTDALSCAVWGVPMTALVVALLAFGL